MGLDVVLVDALGLGLAQHAQGAVQAVNIAVAVAANLGAKQTSARSQIKDADLVSELITAMACFLK